MTEQRFKTRATIGPGDGDPRHGTMNGYRNLSCRCQPCRDAWAVHCARLRADRRLRGLDPDDLRHGKPNTYLNWGCRCSSCRAAHAAAHAVAARIRQLAQAAS